MNKFIFVAFGLLVMSFSVFGQNALENDLNKSFKKYDLVKLDGKNLLGKAKSAQAVEIQAYGRTFDFVLTPNDLRAKNYRAVETTESGERQLENSDVLTYKGKLNGDAASEVRFTITDGKIEGLIYTGDNNKFFLMQADKFSTHAQADDVVVYAENDLLKTLDLSNDTPSLPEGIEGKIEQGNKVIDSFINRSSAAPEISAAEETTTDVRVVEIATEADYQWVTQAGGATAANTEILGILNLVDGIYRRDLNLSVTVTYQHAWSTSDSYAATSSQVLLDAFLAYWNANYPQSQYHRDTAHLFTGKFSNQGIAYQGVTCSNPAASYGLSGRSGVLNYLISAHEIGHNLGAQHVDNSGSCATSLMNPFLTGLETGFCDVSKSQIAAYTAANGSCLTSSGTTPAPTATPTPVPTPTRTPTPNPTPIATPIPTPNCTYSISSTSQNFSATGGNGSVSVTTQTGCSWSVFSTQDFVSVTSYNYQSGSNTATFSVASNTTANYRAATLIIAGQIFTVEQSGTIVTNNATPTRFDFDGDGKADLSVFRPSTGTWYITRSSDNSFYAVNFGLSSDLITPADFDGDGKTDIAVFRPGNGTWYYLKSSTGQFTSIQFGQFGDIPVPGDFDGDGRADISVFRPSNGTWYRLNSSTGQFISTQFGQAGDTPIIGDFDGDFKSDIAVFRPGNGTWYMLRSASGNSFYAISFGQSGDVPTAADFDGDKKIDIVVYRASNGTWYGLNSSNGAFFANQFGVSTDEPTVADFDGDGKADAAVFRPSNGTWYSQRSATGFKGLQFGLTEDIPTSVAK